MKIKGWMTAFIAVSLLSGCRSDADRMAEFCLGFNEIVESSHSCSEMAKHLKQYLDKPQASLRDRSVCTDTPACRPCKHAVRIMLNQCGIDPVMRPVLDELTFSKTLRELQ